MTDNHNPDVTWLVADRAGVQVARLSGRTRVSILAKLDPLFWLGNDVDPVPPDWFEIGGPQWWRAAAWLLRNPMANFMAYVIGVKDYDYTIRGRYPLDEGTPADVGLTGWKWSVIEMPFGLRWGVAVAVLLAALAAALWFGGAVWIFAAVAAAYFLPFALLSLPCVAYAGARIRFYLGWRWEGSFGAKFNIVGSDVQVV
jgi:hypothetical protein